MVTNQRWLGMNSLPGSVCDGPQLSCCRSLASHALTLHELNVAHFPRTIRGLPQANEAVAAVAGKSVLSQSHSYVIGNGPPNLDWPTWEVPVCRL